MKLLPLLAAIALVLTNTTRGDEPQRAMRFQAGTPAEARAWQQAARAKLFALLMGGQQPSRISLDARIVRRIEVPEDACVLEELTLQTLPDRRAHVWLARPAHPKGKVGAILALHGHGGTGEQIVRGAGLYWYGRALIQQGYVVISPDIGQHTLQHTNWSLMGERVWDALCCLDYAVSLPEVDPDRFAVAGLSLGGETSMYVAALDERIKAACSSGWLTTVANLKNGHCPCFNFPGLEANFEFSDIFACVAPRLLVCELGEQERAPGGFPVPIGRQAFAQLRAAYRVFNAESNLTLTVHPGPHVFNGKDFFPKLAAALGGQASAPHNVSPPDDEAAVAWLRFTDAPETLDGTPYHWLGRVSLHLTFDAHPQPGDALELSWGAKADQRDAVLLINGERVTVQGGGHWGFRWLRVPIPAWLKGDHYEIDIREGKGTPAFLSEVRLTSSAREPNRPNLSQSACKAKLTLGTACDSLNRRSLPRNAQGLGHRSRAPGCPCERRAWPGTFPPGGKEWPPRQRSLLPLPPLHRWLARPLRPRHRSLPSQPAREQLLEWP